MASEIKLKGACHEEAIHVDGQDVSQGALRERQEVAMNKIPVIAHIKARSKVLITSGT